MNIMDLRINWSGWTPVSEVTSHSSCAVYRIRTTQSGKPIKIARFLGVDQQGLLSYGMTTNMKSRLRSFNHGLQRGTANSEANLMRLLRLFTKLNRLYPNSRLDYSFMKYGSKAEADLIEEILIKAYVIQYGEVPPLNSAIPQRFNLVNWEAAKVFFIEK